jgi:hypothetical protein
VLHKALLEMETMKSIKLLAVAMLVAGFSSALSASTGVPELDPSNVMSVGLLMGGALLVIRSRRKK